MKIAKKYIRDYAAIVIGSFILALAVSMLLVPCKISSGGVSGIATLLFYLFEIPLWVTTLAINLLLFLLGFGFLPKASLVKTLCGIICFSASLYLTDLIALLLPTLVEAIASDVFLASVFGGVLVGVGVGLVVKHDASTGGRGINMDLVGYFEGLQHVHCLLDNGKVTVTAHDDSDFFHITEPPNIKRAQLTHTQPNAPRRSAIKTLCSHVVLHSSVSRRKQYAYQGYSNTVPVSVSRNSKPCSTFFTILTRKSPDRAAFL